MSETKSNRGGSRPGAGRKPGSINQATAKAREKAEAGGIMPLDFMLEVMRDVNAKREERLDMAKAAAPYVHAKLSSVEAKLDIEGHLDITEIQLVAG